MFGLSCVLALPRVFGLPRALCLPCGLHLPGVLDLPCVLGLGRVLRLPRVLRCIWGRRCVFRPYRVRGLRRRSDLGLSHRARHAVDKLGYGRVRVPDRASVDADDPLGAERRHQAGHRATRPDRYHDPVEVRKLSLDLAGAVHVTQRGV
jgi:hypothetical protein